METDLETARNEWIDPQATGGDAVVRAFENQVAYCRSNEAPITAIVCQALRRLIDTDRGGLVMDRVRRWRGAPLADALPLRVAGGLHTLHLLGDEASLGSIYTGRQEGDAAAIIADVLEMHEAALLPWLDRPPQTNEAGRSSNFIAAMLWLADQGLPRKFAVHELGSSAGINLMLERFSYDLGGVRVGPEDGPIQLTPEWRGKPPPDPRIEIVSARGCDVEPVDLTDEAQAMRLKGYIWPEATERFVRMDAAIVAAREAKPDIARLDAENFVRRSIALPAEPDVTRVIMHSVVWQYVPEDQRHAITRVIERSGQASEVEAPLAWVSVEADRVSHRHQLCVRYWPGGSDDKLLAVAHSHGDWIEWMAGD